MIRTVFLSSTGFDLQPYRDAVYTALSKLEGWRCVRMEDFTAVPDVSPIEYCRTRARSCNLFIGLLGHMYGSVPPGEAASFTEQEYDAAGKNRLIFLAPLSFQVPAALLLAQKLKFSKRQAAFRCRAGVLNLVSRADSFDSPQKLAAEVVAAVHNWEMAHQSGKRSDEVGISVGVDPSTLPLFSAFKDIGTPWCPIMTILPAGEFTMGSSINDADAYPEEFSCHRVSIGYSFAIGRYPITFDEYDFFCEDCQRTAPYDQHWGRGRRPVINVCWSDATSYAQWLSKKTGQSYRLPSESEWEYACRAGTTTRFCYGNTLTQKHANFGHTESGGNHPQARTSIVGSFPANPWGIYDMHGNVWEHVLDTYSETYDCTPCNGQAWMPVDAGDDRVVRGGSFSYGAKDNRSAVRCFHAKDTPDVQHGFRIVRDI